jgi:hypothetical protein
MRAFTPDTDALPDGRGIYALVLRLTGGRARLRVGALGVLSFEPGYYCYVGSARRGLKARLQRHLRRSRKKKHWHGAAGRWQRSGLRLKRLPLPQPPALLHA